MLEKELTSAMASVVRTQCEILTIRQTIETLQEEAEEAEEAEKEDVPVRGTATCNCTGCQRSNALLTLRGLTPLHGLQMRGFSFGVAWGIA